MIGGSLVAFLMCANKGTTTMDDNMNLYEEGEVEDNQRSLTKLKAKVTKKCTIDDMLTQVTRQPKSKSYFGMGTKPTSKETIDKKRTARKYEDHQDLMDCLNDAIMTEVNATESVLPMS